MEQVLWPLLITIRSYKKATKREALKMQLERGNKVLIHNLIIGRNLVVRQMVKFGGLATIVRNKDAKSEFFRLEIDEGKYMWHVSNLLPLQKIDTSYPKHFKPIKGYDCFIDNEN